MYGRGYLSVIQILICFDVNQLFTFYQFTQECKYTIRVKLFKFIVFLQI